LGSTKIICILIHSSFFNYHGFKTKIFANTTLFDIGSFILVSAIIVMILSIRIVNRIEIDQIIFPIVYSSCNISLIRVNFCIQFLHYPLS